MEAGVENANSIECIFKDNAQISCNADEELCNVTYQGVRTILKKCKERSDTLSVTVPPLKTVKETSISGYKCHKNCKATYISKEHIKRHQEKKKNESSEEEPQRRLRSNVHTSSFVWKQHCLFCAEDCNVERDKKNPNRWREAYECHTSDRGERGTFRFAILTVCDEREDKQSEEIRTRLSDPRCSHDLHAADARYHEDCRKKFMKFKKSKSDGDRDDSFQELLQLITDNPQRMWTSIDLEKGYRNFNGSKKQRKALVDGVLKNFGDRMVILTSPGLADIVCFRKHASSIIRLQEDDDEKAKNEEKMIQYIGKKIFEEVKAITVDRTVYSKRINRDIALGDVSSTFLQLLSSISPKFSVCSLPSIMIGNMLTAHVMGRATHLLTALSTMVRKKSTIEHLYDFGVLSSYDELKLSFFCCS